MAAPAERTPVTRITFFVAHQKPDTSGAAVRARCTRAHAGVDNRR